MSQVNTRDGIFAAEGYGGGTFNGNVAFGGLSAYGATRETAPSGLGQGQFVIDVPQQCFDNADFNDCYYQYLGYAQTECTDQDVASMYVDYQDCVADLTQNDVWSRCIPQHCPGGGTVTATRPYEPYPLNTYSAQTKQLQKDINVVLRREGCELIAEDGKLGPATCGAAKYVDPGIVPPTCVKFTPTTCEPKPEPTPQPQPTPQPLPLPIDPGPPVAPQKQKLSMAWMSIGGLAVAAAIGGAYYMSKKGK